MKHPSGSRRFVFIFFVILFGIFLISIINDLARELIIVPLSYSLWIGQLLISSVNQKVIWMALIIVNVLITLVFLIKNRPKPIPAPPTLENDISAIDQWTNKLSRIEDGLYFEWRIIEDLIELTNEVIALRTGSETFDINSDDHSPEKSISSDLIEFLADVQNIRKTLENRKYQSNYKKSSFSLNDVRKIIGKLEDQLNI